LRRVFRRNGGVLFTGDFLGGPPENAFRGPIPQHDRAVERQYDDRYRRGVDQLIE
jgi:hypothetical protein